MKNLTEKDYEALKHYKKRLERVVETKTIKGFNPAELRELGIIYKKVNRTNPNWNCGSCSFTALKSLNTLINRYEKENMH